MRIEARFAALLQHGAIVVLALAALQVQVSVRPVGNSLFYFLPWFGLCLVVLEVVLVVRLVLPPTLYVSLTHTLARTVAVAHVLVLAFAGVSALVLLNALLDPSQPREHASRVKELVGKDADLLEIVSYSWAKVDSWRRPATTERVFLTRAERRTLWGGQAILVRVGDGRFSLPWVVALEEDTESGCASLLSGRVRSVERSHRVLRGASALGCGDRGRAGLSAPLPR